MQFLRRVEAARAKSTLTATDAGRAYRGAYLEYYSFIENSIEKLFLGVVMGRYTFTDSRIRSLVQIDSEAVARRVVFGARLYADWIPFHFTRRRAKAFLSSGRPFTDLAKGDANALDALGVMRNALAHESAHSMRLFRDGFTDGLPLPPGQLRPTGFLRGQYAAGVTRFEYYTAVGLQVVSNLCSR